MTFSTAAQAALQDSREMPTQTAQEAAKGDMQAKHLLVKMAAQRQAMQA